MIRILFYLDYLKEKIYSTVILFVLCVETFTGNAQIRVSEDTMLINERKNFLLTVRSVPADTSVSYPVIKNFELQLNNIVAYLDQTGSLNTIEKEKAKRSLVYFLQEINKDLQKDKIHLYELNDAIVSYQKVLLAVFQHEPLVPVLAPIESNNSQLIAASFTQFNEHLLMDDVATYKRVSASPEYILQFLDAKPGFRFADSLLLEAALYDPMNIIYYLRKNDLPLQQHIRNANNNYIRQIALLSDDKYAKDMTVFAPQIAKGIINSEEILSARMEPSRYFQLQVNTLLKSKAAIPVSFLLPLRNGIREKSLAFYVNEINRLHSSTDAVRFASVNGLRGEDLYFIITSCGDELYTSSYLGLYKRLIAQFDDRSMDILFDAVQWENFRVFIGMAANYNVLNDFLHRLSPEKILEVLRSFIDNIEADPGTALENAMDIADSFSALCEAPQTCDMIQSEIQSNLDRSIAQHHYLGIRLYSILNDMLKLSRQKDGLKKLWNVLGDYETLKHSSLENERRDIIEVLLFYGDEDGVASFNNFLKSFTDRSKWQISRDKYWISIRSLADHPLVIYANRPLNMERQADLVAQDSLFAYLQTNKLDPTILVHRGHSYHLDKTLKRLTPSVKLSILGSCGGYNKTISIASINPDVQVIGSKKTGSKSINDPILDLINETLSRGDDLVWPEIWNKLGSRFKKDEATQIMFNEYFPPSHNLGLFVLKLYKANNML